LNLGIYIHIPFCHRRCTYCDFYLTTNLSLIDKFVDALIKEIKLYSNLYAEYVVDSVFFGGGTPSLLNSIQFQKIISSLYSNFNIAESPEITMECNPEDIIGDVNKFSEFSKIGANRISVGVQSFIDKELKFLTRLHNGDDAVKALEISKKFFNNVSTDLIYSFNGQVLKDIEYNINKILELDLQHVSAYTLILEKGTLLYKEYENNNLLQYVDNENPLFYEFVNNMLRDNCYEHYEVSNYAKTGFLSRHNLKYWNFDHYLGMGPSAHSFNGNSRFINVKSVNGYIDKLSKDILPLLSSENLSASQLKNDYFISVFRSQGVNLQKYNDLFGNTFLQDYKNVSESLLNLNLAELDDERFKLTEKGFALADEITLGFLQ
jgi:oxygen-independent coproporphyrinogen-3 oxidase